MSEEKQTEPKVRITITGWGNFASFWRSFGRGLGKALLLTVKLLKWPALLALPVLIFLVSTWLSMISSLSSDIKTVPDLTNLTPQQAEEQLSIRSLRLAVEEHREFSDWNDEGTILRQLPSAGARIKRGRTVHVTLSAGPRNVLVPNLLGNSVREAKLVAEQKGFKLRERRAIFSDRVAEGLVIAQNPLPSSAFVTESIDILESKGQRPKLVMVPQLEGRPLLPVLDFLRGQGVKVVVLARGSNDEISGRDRFELRHYIIYRQSPAAGLFIQIPGSEEIILRVEWSER